MLYGYQGYSVEPTPNNPNNPNNPKSPNSPYNPNNPKHPMPPIEKSRELAQAYVPVQIYANSFSPAEALEHGTLFPELVRPYTKRS